MDETTYDSAVAIIGMSGRFPGADDVDELWARSAAGIPGLRLIDDDELSRAGIGPELRADPSYVRVGGPVAGIEMFDAAAFGFSAHEAETMEPQHRLFLECSWEALERSGYSPMECTGSVGVFAGCAFPDYMIDNALHLASEPGDAQLFATGNERDSLTSLVSYKLGLRGPSLTVQTFCSTSLVAVHLACQSLLIFESDLALAGGAHLPLPQPAGYRHDEHGILSPDGRVRSLDAAANGTVMGSGVGVVALKRMTDALADGDVIHAVILGSAVNNDGRDRAGYTAPGIAGQAAVIKSAQAVAGVAPESIGYVECHAVGTPMGDAIEIAALNRVFDTPRASPCVLSSIKPSIGHLDRAAGVTGLIRAALSLRHETLPGTADFQAPNPAVAAHPHRFQVLAANRPWPAGSEPRRAGVSSFGVGGTNAHLVLEQAPPTPAGPPTPGPHLLTFSAGSPAALDALTSRLRHHLHANRTADLAYLADVAYTLGISRGRFALRRAVICADVNDAVAALGDPARWIDGETTRRDPQVRLDLVDTAEPVPESWWQQLADAALSLLPGAARSVERLGALSAGLAHLGVRLTAEDAPAAVEVALIPGGEPAEDWVLGTVARLWLAGSRIHWAVLHRGSARRVELPSYPFQRQRHWIEAAPDQRPATHRSATTRTYLPTWRQHPLTVADLDARLRAAGPWLVLAADNMDTLGGRLTLAGAEVVTVRPSRDFRQDEIGDFSVRPDNPDDLAKLTRSLLVNPRTVVHAFSPGSGEPGCGERSVLALVQAFERAPDLSPAELILLTSGAVGVLGADLLHPEHAALAGLASTLARDIGVPNTRHVDLDVGADLDQVLAAAIGPHEGPVAVRGGHAWLRRYEPYPLAPADPDRPGFAATDTVLITGGLHGVGLLLAQHLATRGRRLVLTTGAPSPPRHGMADGGVSANILDLERRGAATLTRAVDVTDLDGMRDLVRDATHAFGGIDAVVYAAAAPYNQDSSGCGTDHEQYRTGVEGLRVLNSVIDEQAPDRRLVVCSAAGVLGGPGSGPAAALAAHAGGARLHGPGRWLTVSWDADQQLTVEESVDLLERAVAESGHLAHIIVSAHPLDELAPDALAAAGTASAAADRTPATGRRPRPALATPYVTPGSGIETVVAELFAVELGLDCVGADDNFFDLGGRSMGAVRVAAEVREATCVDLPVTALVLHPTARLLSATISTRPAEELS